MSQLSEARRDFARSPPFILLWWAAPMVIGNVANAMRLTLTANAAVWALCLIWMATGCVLNAARCHRLHCFVSGPVLLAGAAGAGLIAAGVSLAPFTLNTVLWTAFGLALASFAPEFLWRRYV